MFYKIVNKEITFLDPKRSQNCNIMIRAIKLTPARIAKGVDEVDLVTLSRPILSELRKFVPTDEEVGGLILLRNYQWPLQHDQKLSRPKYELPADKRDIH